MKSRTLLILLALLLVVNGLVFILLDNDGIVKKDKPSDFSKYFDKTSMLSTDSDLNESDDIYASPVDFEQLWKINPDIYAWIEIPGTSISYPILQNEDDSFYFQKDINKKFSTAGSIYTEGTYNEKDFNDPVTLIYGHNMSSGAMFGALQKAYSSKESLKEHEEIVIYLPDKELRYTVFSAVPFDNRHILYNHDFTNKRTFRLFFRDIMCVKSLEAVIPEDRYVDDEDKVIILSTCLASDDRNRYLVCAKLEKMFSK